ncbi:hypothetical protein ACGFZU_06670 [Streptomyces tendae]|uniref:hypothetical protein n=1 Tax=Streptomyces tendae TaxID=1932 RepID=UPI003724A540
MAAEITTSIRSHMVNLGVQGAPVVDNRWGSGSIRPTQVQITYWYDTGAGEPDAVVRLFGTWIRESGEETDHVVDVTYDRGRRNWPGWLVDVVKTNKPKESQQ